MTGLAPGKLVRRCRKAALIALALFLSAWGAPAFAQVPNLSINDVSVAEGNAGTSTATFVVSLSAPAGAGGVTFDIGTGDGTATTANADYVAQNLIGQAIPVGGTTYNFSVVINGDTAIEANESYFVNVTNVVGAIVTDGQGLGTIGNDDVVVAVPTLSEWAMILMGLFLAMSALLVLSRPARA